MGQSNHRGNREPQTRNHGSRMSEKPGNASPEEEARHDPSMLEAFGQEGAGTFGQEGTGTFGGADGCR